jgi:ATP/maltotriose-dependent transcriptional regulator MalT
MSAGWRRIRNLWCIEWARSRLWTDVEGAPVLPRPRLESRMAQAMARRLTCVVAGAGFGKTTLVASWAAGARAAWYTATPEDAEWPALGRGLARVLPRKVPGVATTLLAGLSAAGPEAATERDLRPEAWSAMACEALEDLEEDLALVIDDAHELWAGTSATMVESLCRHSPPKLHLVLASRSDVPFPLDRWRGRGQVLELGGRELAFSEAELAELLAVWLDPDAAELAPALSEATGGWPAAVRLSAEAIWARPPAQRGEALEELHRQEGPVFSYLAAEALAVEPPEVSELVRAAARLDHFTAATCEAVGVARASETAASLLRRGLFIEAKPGQRWLALYPLVREFALERLPMEEADELALHRRAAAWVDHAGFPEEARQEDAAGGDEEALAGALLRYGPQLLVSARANAVLRGAECLPRPRPELDVVVGEARQLSGDWEGALACYRRAAEGQPTLPSGLAWRLGLIHYLRGDIDEAQATYQRARLDGQEQSDDALVLAWRASIHFLTAEREACEADAGWALELALRSGDSRALAAAHTVLAMLSALVGDRTANRAHYHLALEHAARAGDVLQLIRIRSNRGSHLTEEGCYRDALAELEAGVRLTEVTGFAALRAHILCNRAEAQLHLGQLDESAADLDQARRIYEQLGSWKVCLPLAILGDVRRERGEPLAARACYEEALAILQRSPDQQIAVPALAGLARLLSDTDPEEAGRLVKQALDLGRGQMQPIALQIGRAHV